MTLRQAIEYLGNNKKLSAREAVVYGITTFGQIIKLITELLLKNDTNSLNIHSRDTDMLANKTRIVGAN